MRFSRQTSTIQKPRRQGLFADVFLHILFGMARYATWALRSTKSLWVECGWRLHKPMRQGLLANAARILGPESTKAQHSQLARQVTGHFYDFVSDFAYSAGLSRPQLLERVASIEGQELYKRTRAEKRGAILATAHMGNFEVSMAALAEREPKLHVVFHRDAFGQFERVRARLRKQLGVTEHMAEEGWPMWLRLRDALMNDEVVMLQADRVMPGHKGVLVPCMGGHIRLPTGPAKLAAISGSPIVPVFSERHADGSVRIMIEPPIEVSQATYEAVRQLAAVLEKHIRARPQQWMMPRKAWIEDLKPWESHV